MPESQAPLVQPGRRDDGSYDKNGCLWCPLLPFSPDFHRFRSQYRCKAETIRNREPDHEIITRKVEQKWTEVDVLLVGEAPGKVEDKKGDPFTGRSGKYMWDLIDTVPTADEVTFGATNSIRCRPPRNRDPNKSEIRACSVELIREIRARKPKLLVALGRPALHALTGLESGILALQGQMLDSTLVPGMRVLACVHPSYVQRLNTDKAIDDFADCITTAVQFVQGKFEERAGLGEYTTLTNLDEIDVLLAGMIADGKDVSFDLETGVLIPQDTRYPQVLSVHLTTECGKGWSIPYDHPNAPWTQPQRKHLREALRDFFQNPIPKIGQNCCKFDRQHIFHEFGVYPANIVRDTMLTHMTVDERPGTHGLKFLAYIYTGMGGYERPLEQYIERHPEANPDKGGSYANIPGEILFPYGAADADCALRVDAAMRDLPEFKENKKLQALAFQLLPALAETLSDLEYTGAFVDLGGVRQLHVESVQKMEVLREQIQDLPNVKRFVIDQIRKGKTGRTRKEQFQFNPASPQQTRRVLFQYYGLPPLELTDTGFEILRDRYNIRKARVRERVRLQLQGKAVDSSKKTKSMSFRDVWRESVGREEWDYFSVRSDVMHEYNRQGNDLAPLALEYRKVDKFNNTFVEPILDLLDKDGLIHGSFWPWGASTGRLSSSNPNLQNVMKRTRRVYRSRFGTDGVMLNGDYSQIELRVAACLYEEPCMIEAYLRGEDLHLTTAIDLAQMTVEVFMRLPEAVREDWRRRAKSVNFGIIYQGGARMLMRTLAKDGIFITEEEGTALIDQFYELRPSLKMNIEREEQRLIDQGYLEAFTGRRRRLPDVHSENREIVSHTLRQGVNFPVQCGASEITVLALILCNRAMRAQGLRSRLMLTVHDNLVSDCHVDEVLAVAQFQKEIMESVPERSDEVMPGIDWEWLKVPLQADFGIGVSWGQLVDFDPLVVNGVRAPAESGPLYVEDEEGLVTLARTPHDVDELWNAMAWKVAV